jgi:predicted DNA binding protein
MGCMRGQESEEHGVSESTIAVASVPASAAVLEETLRSIRDVRFELETVVASGSDAPMPLIWAFSDDLDAVEAALDADETIVSYDRLSEGTGRRLYRMKWVEGAAAIDHLLDEAGIVLDAYTRDYDWCVRLLFEERSALSAAVSRCEAAGIDLSIEMIKDVSIDAEEPHALTDGQRVTLSAAYENGYYDVPRAVTLSELSEELGISHQSLSERLRRAHRAVIEELVHEGTVESTVASTDSPRTITSD